MIDDIVHAVAECGGDACSVQGAALLLYAVSAWRNLELDTRNEKVDQLFSTNENVATFFPKKMGCDRPFFLQLSEE